MRSTLAPIVDVSLFGLAGCGFESAPAARVSVLVAIDGGGRGPAYGEAPMPTDALRAEHGALEPQEGLEAIAPAGTEALRRQLAALEGFGLRPTVELFLDGDVDPAPLTRADFAVAAIDLADFGSRHDPEDVGNNFDGVLTSFSGDPKR